MSTQTIDEQQMCFHPLTNLIMLVTSFHYLSLDSKLVTSYHVVT